MTAPIIPAHLARQARKVAQCLLRPKWWTLDELSKLTGAPTQSVSARLRDLRKARWGSHKVDRIESPRSRRVFLYRLRTREQLKKQLKATEVRP